MLYIGSTTKYVSWKWRVYRFMMQILLSLKHVHVILGIDHHVCWTIQVQKMTQRGVLIRFESEHQSQKTLGFRDVRRTIFVGFI